MSIIDTTYFINEVFLPVDEIQAELESYILRFEPEILEKTLGYDLKKSFLNAIAGTPAQKWLDLLNGKEYQYEGIYYNWIGLSNSLKRSLIANYVFYQYSIYGMNYNSALGIKAVSSENSQIIDKRRVQVLVYNDMVKQIEQMHDFINVQNSLDSSTYPNFEPETIKRINIFNI